MKDAIGAVLILAGIAGGLYLLSRTKGDRRKSAWSQFPVNAETDATGVNFNPAFASTAATSEPLFTGEPETGAGGPGCFKVATKKKSCGC